jgi:uncharacterized membrane protein YfcA
MLEFIIPFLISTLMGIGVGGGGLYIIYLAEIIKMDLTLARGTNLAFFIISALASMLIHLKNRHFYPCQLVIMIFFGVIGSYIFSHLSNMIDPEIPKKVLGSVLILGGGISFYSVFKELKDRGKK